MKKLIAMLLCVALVAAMGAAAYAIDPAPDPQVIVNFNDNPSAPDAANDGLTANAAAADARLAGSYVSAAKEVAAVVKAYQDVRDDTSTSALAVANAYETMVAGLARIAANPDYAALIGSGYAPDGTMTLAILTTATNYTGYQGADFATIQAAAVAQGYTGANFAAQVDQLDANGNIVDTAREVSGFEAAAKVAQAAKLVEAAQYSLAVVYDMSNGTPMDWNAYIIGATAKEQAQQTTDAKAAADAAKAGAVTAQSTAKSLINQAMAVAQDAAAEAVANAQTTAYNNLAAAYATAVSDFWAGVSAEIATW